MAVEKNMKLRGEYISLHKLLCNVLSAKVKAKSFKHFATPGKVFAHIQSFL